MYRKTGHVEIAKYVPSYPRMVLSLLLPPYPRIQSAFEMPYAPLSEERAATNNTERTNGRNQ